jgi:hypothetical protein
MSVLLLRINYCNRWYGKAVDSVCVRVILELLNRCHGSVLGHTVCISDHRPFFSGV